MNFYRLRPSVGFEIKSTERLLLSANASLSYLIFVDLKTNFFQKSRTGRKATDLFLQEDSADFWFTMFDLLLQ